jgi:hypothetical protein
MKKLYTIIRISILFLFINAGYVFADGIQSFKIDDQTGTFVVKFTASPSAAMMNGAIGFGGVEVKAFGDFNCVIRFNPTGQIDVRNGTAYAALTPYNYTAGRRYFFMATIDVVNKKYSVVVHEMNGGTEVTLATDYSFRLDNFTGTLSYFSEFVVDATNQNFVGISDFTIGTSTSISEDNYNIPLPKLSGDFGVKFMATPSHLPLNAVVGMSDIEATGYGDLGPIIVFGGDSTIKVRNGAAYAADVKVKYEAGAQYMFYVTGNTVTHKYNVILATPDRKIINLATDYSFRKLADNLNYLTTKLSFDPVYAGVDGSFLAIDGLIAGKLGYDGNVHPSASSFIGNQATAFARNIVVTASESKINAAVGYNKLPAVAWGDFNAIVNFIQDDTIQVRNGAAYLKTNQTYQKGDSYIVGLNIDPVTKTYKVTLDKGLYSTPVEIATDFGFRLNNPGDTINYFTSKDVWTAGIEGTYLITSSVAVKMPPLTKIGGNISPTIGSVTNQSLFTDSNPLEIALSGITYGTDPTPQTIEVTSENSDPNVATVTLVYTPNESTGKLTITPKNAGETTVKVTVKDNGGVENLGVDTKQISFTVTVSAAQIVQNYTISTADGIWGADNQILIGNDGVGFYEGWRMINRGLSEGKGNNDIGVVNVMPNFTYSFYLRFDLSNLPDKGACTEAKLKVFSQIAVKGFTGIDVPRAVDDLVLYVLQDAYEGGPDFEGYVPELTEFYDEGSQVGGWTSVLNASNKYTAGYEKYICADNAPGFNEGNSEEDIKSSGWDYFNTEALSRVGTTYRVELGDTALVVDVADLKKAISTDSNNAIVFVLAKLPSYATSGTEAQELFRTTSFPIYTGESKGYEPRLELTWDKSATVVNVVNFNKKNISLFPNPASTMLQVKYPMNTGKMEVYSSAGVKVATYKPQNSLNTTLNISNLNSGLYFMRVLDTQNNLIDIVKFVKNR